MTLHNTAVGVCFYWTVLSGIVNVIKGVVDEKMYLRVASLVVGALLLAAAAFAL